MSYFHKFVSLLSFLKLCLLYCQKYLPLLPQIADSVKKIGLVGKLLSSTNLLWMLLMKTSVSSCTAWSHCWWYQVWWLILFLPWHNSNCHVAGGMMVDFILILLWHNQTIGTLYMLSLSCLLFFRISATCVWACARVLQQPHKFENFIMAASTLAQVGGFAQKSFWSSFVKICQCLGVAQWHQNFDNLKKNFFFILNVFGR